MKNRTVKTGTMGKGLYFLLAPEDSSATASGPARKCESTAWHRTKTAVWVVFSVLAALLVGQL